MEFKLPENSPKAATSRFRGGTLASMNLCKYTEPWSSFTDAGSWAGCRSATGVQIHLLCPFCYLSVGREDRRMGHVYVCEYGASVGNAKLRGILGA